MFGQMDDRSMAALFAALACICAASTAAAAANASISHFFIILPLVLMATFLFVAGYYAGRYRTRR